MNALTIAVANHLKVEPSQIKEIRDFKCWNGGEVWLAVIQGKGARFVSKKVVKMSTREEAAKLVKSALENEASESYQVSIWQKNGRVRLYIKDMGYKSASAQDQGYFAFNSDGTPFYDGLKRNSSVVRFIRKALEGIQVASDAEAEKQIQESKEAFNSRQPQTIQESWAAYHRDNQPKEWHFGATDEESF